jgi:hypothetical protein
MAGSKTDSPYGTGSFAEPSAPASCGDVVVFLRGIGATPRPHSKLWATRPKGIRYFQDEVFLEEALRFEFVDQGVDELVVLGAVLFEMGGFENNIAGIEAVFDGVTT